MIFTKWQEAKYFKPDEREHIVFKCEQGDQDWHDGIYFAEDDEVKHLLTVSPMPIYEIMPFDAVSYWMRIPPAPGEKK